MARHRDDASHEHGGSFHGRRMRTQCRTRGRAAVNGGRAAHVDKTSKRDLAHDDVVGRHDCALRPPVEVSCHGSSVRPNVRSNPSPNGLHAQYVPHLTLPIRPGSEPGFWLAAVQAARLLGIRKGSALGRKESVSIPVKRIRRVSTSRLCPCDIGRPSGSPVIRISDGVALLDVIYVVAAIALFGLIALIARAVEKL
jgi:hypothetical protein